MHIFQQGEILADPDHSMDRSLEIVAPLSPAREDHIRFIDGEGGYRLPEELPFVAYSVNSTPNLFSRAATRFPRFRKSLPNRRLDALSATAMNLKTGSRSA